MSELNISIIEQFLSEHNDLYFKNLNKLSKESDSELHHVERIMTHPRFHPTSELKKFYKKLNEKHNLPFRMLLVGNSALSKIMFINVLLKNSLIPINDNALMQKKIVVKYNAGSFSFVRGFFHSGDMTPINIHTFEHKILEDIERFEIFCNNEILEDIEIIKDVESIDKGRLKEIKNADLIVFLHNLEGQIDYKETLKKIVKKKEVITVLTYINKTYTQSELAEQISSDAFEIDSTLGLADIYDVDLWSLFYKYRLDERFAFHKIFETLNKNTSQNVKTKTLSTALELIENARQDLESFYEHKQIQKEADSLSKQSPKDSKQNEEIELHKIQTIIKTIESKLKIIRLNRNKTLLKEALRQNKIIDNHYKILFQHYKSLDMLYHRANIKLVDRFNQLNEQFNKDGNTIISKSMKKYLDSIVQSVLDNVETIKLKTRPNNPSLLDNLTNKLIIFSGFRVNVNEIYKELEDSQSFLARRYQSLLTRIEHFNIYIKQNIEEALHTFSNAIYEWIQKGHYLVLQKKPGIISMDKYFSLEEFNLNVHANFTVKHFDILRGYVENIHTKLLALNIWLNATKKIILEFVVQKLQEKFQNDRDLAKEKKVHKIKPVSKDFIIDSIIAFLPPEIQNLFCEPPHVKQEFKDIATILKNEGKENEKIIRNRMREIIELRRSIKEGIKILEGV